VSDFCQECSIKLFGEDFGELSHHTDSPIDVLCEGCGPILVNQQGYKVGESDQRKFFEVSI
jgi:hypothetical protein